MPVEHFPDPWMTFAKLIITPDLVHDEICITEQKAIGLCKHLLFTLELSFGN